MDLEELKILSQTNAETIAPFRKIIYGLISTLLLTVGLFGYCFITFMYKAFDAPAGEQTVAAYEISSSTLTQNVGK
jgi:hypothetical protein